MAEYEREWFIDALNAMSDLVLIKGPKSKLLWANEAFLRYYGMTADELLDIVDAPHSDPDNTLQYVIDDQKVFDTAEPLDIAAEEVTSKDGSVRLFHTVKTPVFKHGAVDRTVGVSRLLEDEPGEDKLLRHRDAKAFAAPLTTITKHFPAPFMLLDVHGRILNSSPLWKTTFGDYSDSPNVFFEDQYPELNEVSKLINQALADKREVVDKRLKVKTRSGSAAYFDISISTWVFPNNETGGVGIVANEVTTLVKYTASLEKANDELAQFSYRASHDLKSPLITISRLVDYIAQDIRDGHTDEALKNISRIGAQARQLENTVSDVLNLHKAGADHTEVRETFNLGTLVKTIQEKMSWLFEDASCELRVEGDLQLDVYAEKVRYHQLIENLVSNGVKYRDLAESPCYVVVRFYIANSSIVIEVADNGIGIPTKYHHDVMTMFKRFHPERSSGSGLGLAIVKKHVDALGGTIKFQSSEQGTMFTITTPYRKAQ